MFNPKLGHDVPTAPQLGTSRFLSGRRCRVAFTRLIVAAVGIPLLLSGFGEVAAVEAVPEKPTAPVHSMETGFTRESMEALGKTEPEAKPVVARKRTAIRAKRLRRLRQKRYAARQRRLRRVRARQQQRQAQPSAVVKASRRRNPVESFIYGWNGWVMDTFHTKFGTVLLGTIGAKKNARRQSS